MKTTEKNNLIAEFLHGKNATHPNQYHENWNELMPVIKKIRQIVNTELSINDFDKHRGLEQRLNPYNYNIESVYNGSVEFIKWYNEQTPKP